MVKMIATKAQTYNNKTIAAGEEFEVEDRYVATLQSLSRATVKDASTKARPTATKATSEEEKPKAKAEPAAEEEEPKTKYRTREMKARE